MCAVTHWYVRQDSSPWMSHVTHVNEFTCVPWLIHANESWRTYQWVTSYMQIIHVTHINESCHIYQWVVSHISMSHVIHANKSCHTCQWVTSHISMNHVTHINESRHTYEWITSYMQKSHVTHMNESCNFNMPRPYVRPHVSTCVTCLILMHDMADSNICDTKFLPWHTHIVLWGGYG